MPCGRNGSVLLLSGCVNEELRLCSSCDVWVVLYALHAYGPIYLCDSIEAKRNSLQQLVLACMPRFSDNKAFSSIDENAF